MAPLRLSAEESAALHALVLLQRYTLGLNQVAEQAQRLLAVGASRVEFGTPHGLTPQEGLRLLGERVLPALGVRV